LGRLVEDFVLKLTVDNGSIGVDGTLSEILEDFLLTVVAFNLLRNFLLENQN